MDYDTDVCRALGATVGPRAVSCPRVQDVVNTHPGLAFLKEASEFHSRYITTVSTQPPLAPGPIPAGSAWRPSFPGAVALPVLSSSPVHTMSVVVAPWEVGPHSQAGGTALSHVSTLRLEPSQVPGRGHSKDACVAFTLPGQEQLALGRSPEDVLASGEEMRPFLEATHASAGPPGIRGCSDPALPPTPAHHRTACGARSPAHSPPRVSLRPSSRPRGTAGAPHSLLCAPGWEPLSVPNTQSACAWSSGCARVCHSHLSVLHVAPQGSLGRNDDGNCVSYPERRVLNVNEASWGCSSHTLCPHCAGAGEGTSQVRTGEGTSQDEDR